MPRRLDYAETCAAIKRWRSKLKRALNMVAALEARKDRLDKTLKGSLEVAAKAKRVRFKQNLVPPTVPLKPKPKVRPSIPEIAETVIAMDAKLERKRERDRARRMAKREARIAKAVLEAKANSAINT